MRKIMFATLGWGLLGMALLVPPHVARAAELHWKFRSGEALHYVMEQKTVTTVKVENQEIQTTLNQTIDMTWAIKGVDDKGTADMTQKFDRVRTKIESTFGKFEYDSHDKKEPEGPIAAGLVPLLKALVSAEFSFKMNTQGTLSDVKVPETLAKTLRDASAGQGGAAAGPFSEDGLKNMITESSLSLPEKDLAKGDSWTQTTKVPTPPIGTMVLDKTFRYEGFGAVEGKDVEKIALETKVSVEPMPDSKVAFKIKTHEGKGVFGFDNAKGRVTDSHVAEKIAMALTIQDQGLDQVVDTSTSLKLVSVDEPAK